MGPVNRTQLSSVSIVSSSRFSPLWRRISLRWVALKCGRSCDSDVWSFLRGIASWGGGKLRPRKSKQRSALCSGTFSCGCHDAWSGWFPPCRAILTSGLVFVWGKRSDSRGLCYCVCLCCGCGGRCGLRADVSLYVDGCAVLVRCSQPDIWWRHWTSLKSDAISQSWWSCAIKITFVLLDLNMLPCSARLSSKSIQHCKATTPKV